MNKRYRKQKRQSKMDKAKTQDTLDTRHRLNNTYNKRINKMGHNLKMLILNSIACIAMHHALNKL
jgi:hypothetical protein